MCTRSHVGGFWTAIFSSAAHGAYLSPTYNFELLVRWIQFFSYGKLECFWQVVNRLGQHNVEKKTANKKYRTSKGNERTKSSNAKVICGVALFLFSQLLRSVKSASYNTIWIPDVHGIQLTVHSFHWQNHRDCSKDTDRMECECNLVQSTSGAQRAAATAEGRIHNTVKGKSEGRAASNLV